MKNSELLEKITSGIEEDTHEDKRRIAEEMTREIGITMGIPFEEIEDIVDMLI